MVIIIMVIIIGRGCRHTDSTACVTEDVSSGVLMTPCGQIFYDDKIVIFSGNLVPHGRRVTRIFQLNMICTILLIISLKREGIGD